jgi:putative tryptophan/tyrosine transport system substrate-binding protein
VKRREFIILLGGGAAVAWPPTARAQRRAMPVIGFLNGTDPETNSHLADAFREGVTSAGYVEGRNVAIEYRWAENHYDRLPALAADLVRRQVAVIFAGGGGGVAPQAAKAATATIPIVFTGGFDPVQAGLVASLNRPGGNVTGVSFLVNELGAKRLGLLHELVPTATTVGFLVDPTNPNAEPETVDMRAAANTLGRKLLVARASTATEVDAAFANFVEQRAGALVVAAEIFFLSRRVQLAARSAPFDACNISFARNGDGGRPHELRHQRWRRVSSGRRVYRAYSQGGAAERSASPATHQIRADNQPQDRQSARPRRAADTACARRRGH